MADQTTRSVLVLVIDDSPTILKVVQLVLSKAGFKVLTAADGERGLELARAERPAMILLDFVMPRMNGYQVCRALAAEAGLKDVPVVLMSAKGDQVGERFVKVMGIVDYITKPFSPEAITAVVQHTIAKYASGTGVGPAPTSDGDGAARADSEGDEPENGSPDEDAPPTATHRTSPEASRERLLAELRRELLATLGESLADAAKAEGELGDEVLARLVAPLAPAALEPAPAALAGELAVVPIAEVLQLLAAQSQSGVLEVDGEQAGQKRVDACFRGGKIDFAGHIGMADEFLLGRFIVDSQLMSEHDLDAFLKSRQPGGGKLLGSQLVKLGYLSELELKQAISRQTSELIYDILRWKRGRFAFRPTRELPPVASLAALGLDVEGILMEGFRRVDEWHLIERELEDFEQVFLRNEDAVAHMGRARLTREELAVLELVNGKHSVKDIIRQSKLGSFDVSKMLYRLLSIKLVRRRVAPVAV
jgi:DNA-binding response OmpR family regulator